MTTFEKICAIVSIAEMGIAYLIERQMRIELQKQLERQDELNRHFRERLAEKLLRERNNDFIPWEAV